eukprot:TRINITY_DN8728_c0_g1_i1.p2 TRINITY_DN8728_c0_g1~~TRINITY_DN8728_c0_g1_i1.p2  ORF type:complete len:160 (-),score=16.04 TRINITY_DN8728_c0_g1_i1:39-518(-)
MRDNLHLPLLLLTFITLLLQSNKCYAFPGNMAFLSPFSFDGNNRLKKSLESPEHGNYCGLRNLDPTYKTPPLDWIDAACMVHDQCSDKKLLDCRCDTEIVDNLLNLIKYNHFDRKNKEIAQRIIHHYRLSGCSCLVEEGDDRSRMFYSEAKGNEKRKCL